MVDLNREIYNILKEIATVEPEFPTADSEGFPIITINEVSNVESFETEGAEVASDITFQVDIWDNTQTLERVNTLAIKASALMYKHRYKRILGRGFTDLSGLKRNMMYFKITVINLKEND